MSGERTELPSGAMVFTDADTGEEMLYFVRTYYRRHDAIPLRTPLPFLYLRDSTTKRFIKRLDAMEVRYFEEVSYSAEEAKKGNPLYVDAVTKTVLQCTYIRARVVEDEKRVWRVFVHDDVKDVEDVEDKLGHACESVVSRYFGHFVMSELLEDKGIEYGSELTVSEKASESKCHYVVVWKHHEAVEPKTEEGTEPL